MSTELNIIGDVMLTTSRPTANDNISKPLSHYGHYDSIVGTRIDFVGGDFSVSGICRESRVSVIVYLDNRPALPRHAYYPGNDFYFFSFFIRERFG